MANKTQQHTKQIKTLNKKPSNTTKHKTTQQNKTPNTIITTKHKTQQNIILKIIKKNHKRTDK